jgi:hypothetical protein
VVICIADGSHFARERLTAFTLWHLDAVSGSHPPHLLSGVHSLDPSATLAVHRGNGFDADFSPYQSTRLSR